MRSGILRREFMMNRDTDKRHDDDSAEAANTRDHDGELPETTDENDRPVDNPSG